MLMTELLPDVLFAATLARADEAAVKMLHKRLNTCDADAKQTDITMHAECSETQLELSKQYSSWAVYQAACKANQ